MSAIRRSFKNWRWYHWTATTIVLLYLTYIALSYLYLPGKLKDVVQSEASKTLGRKVTVQRIAFNPFTLALTAEGFAIADRPQLPLVSWQRLYVNFDAWGSLFGWKARFSAVELDAPHIAVERRRRGFNFSDIVDRLSKPASKAAPAAKSRPLALKIDDIRIDGGRFRFDDVSGSKPAQSIMRNIALHVQDLYLATNDRQLNPFRLQAAMPGGGRLRLSGRYRAQPLQVQAQIKAQDIHLKAFSDFVRNQLPITVSDGDLTLQTDVDVSMNDKLQVQLKHGDISVTKLALDDATDKPPLLRCKGIRVQDIAMDLTGRRFSIGAVTVDGLDTNQWLDADGRSRVDPLLSKGQPSPQATKGSPGKPWDVAIDKTLVKNSRVAFTDRRNGLDATQRVHRLNVTLGRLQLNSARPVPVKVDGALNDRGTFGADGQITLAPFRATLAYQAQKVALMPFNPYVRSMSWLELRQGTVKVDGKVKIDPKAHQPLVLGLNAGIDGLKAVDTRSGKAVLQWKALNIAQLKVDLDKRDLSIDKITLDTPRVAGKRGSDKKIDLATLMKGGSGGQSAAAGKPSTGQASPPWRVAVHTIALNNGTVRFTDAGIHPPFKTGLYAIRFKLERLTSAGGKPAPFTFNAKIDRYAPFTVKGTLEPLQQQPGFAFTSRLQGLEMPTLSTYTGTYIGYNLKSGTLGLNLKYDLKHRTLKGKNDIVAKQLYLGDEVKSDQAVHLPVALGLALLRDANGVIDLNLNVSGDINDPSFSVSGIIFKALKNIIIKAATSPFHLLASLVGGSEDLGHVEFAAGTSALDEDNQHKLRQLTAALTKRPQLAVTVSGCAGQAADDGALQMRRVLKRLAEQRKVPVSELKSQGWLDLKANRKALRELNARLKLADESQRRKAVAAAHPDLKGEDLMKQVYQNMLHDVAAAQTITREDRVALADQRALAIKQFLVDTAGLDHSRVQMKQKPGEELKGRVCDLGMQPL